MKRFGPRTVLTAPATRGRLALAALALALAVLAATPALATAQTTDANGVEHLHYAAGPYRVIPGANLILDDYNNVPKPHENGFMIRMQPNLVDALPNGKCCGKVPDTSIVHLHHGVWLSNGRDGQGEGESSAYGPLYPFMAAGEEKTIIEFPQGFGYPIGANDVWILNYMIHNLTDKPLNVYITYNMDFVPATAPLASTITPVHPIWMDVQNHHIYPVFNVRRGAGRHGKFTYPDMAKNPYGGRAPLNEFTVDHPGTLIETAGHLHPGGLYDDLELVRPGVQPARGIVRGNVPNSVHLFRSKGVYWDKGHQPVSWDVGMTRTADDWRPNIQQGDVLRVSATYETKLASWYEVMGIMVVWEAWFDERGPRAFGGVDPFVQQVDQAGHVTHGHLPENSFYGGTRFVGVDPTAAPLCNTRKVLIAGFRYIPAHGSPNCVPTIRRGQALTFYNMDASPMGTFLPIAPNPFYLASVFHTVTSCQNPCRLNYGISYPIANGGASFDSGELGAGLPGVGRLSWNTPTNLPPGTYAFFCRIHPWMRGVFKIIH